VNTPATIDLFGISVARCTLPEVVAIAERHITDGSRFRIGVINAAKVVKMRRDNFLRDSVCSSDIIVADGASIVLASKVLGEPLPERVTGIELMHGLLRSADQHKSRVFLLGATEEVSMKVESWIKDNHPDAIICGRANGYFKADDESMLVEKIRESKPDMLFVAITSPKKEIFVARWEDQLGATVLHGVGGSFDVVAGKVQRAPLFFQKWGLEWLYRVIQEPRRLAWRYISTNTMFLLMLFGEIIRRLFVRSNNSA